MSDLDLEKFRKQGYYPGIDQHKSTYEEGEVPACTYTARLIFETLKGKGIVSKILWLRNEEDETGHAYIVLDRQQDDELPYNQPEYSVGTFTVGDIRRLGEDITEEIENEPWDML